MKTIKVYEFKDLEKTSQHRIIAKTINDIIETELEVLYRQFEEGLLSEKEYYNTMGCSKNYAETTAWFIPACYYEKHKKEVDEEVKKVVSKELYNADGKYIQTI